VDAEQTNQPAPIKRLTAQALAISLTNPKAMVAIAALLPPLFNPQAATAPQVIILSVSYGVLCALNHVVIAYSGNWFRRFLSSPKRAQRLRRITGGTFFGFGVGMIASTR
jgi:homoserine/homoserine lactone efflux protein